MKVNKMTNEKLIKIKMFFGFKIIPIGGQVSPGDWTNFEQQVLAQTFEGFNVVDSVGYYKGVRERSKVVTIIMDESEKDKVEYVAKIYCKEFKQKSVMVATIPVQSCEVITA